MKKYKHIFFDLDRTLWDYDRNSSEALGELYRKHHLAEKGIATLDQLVDAFHRNNERMWADFVKGSFGSQKLFRELRFYNTLKDAGINDKNFSDLLSEEYVSIAPYKTTLIEGTKEILEYLSKKYQLHIITNGFEHVQHIKLNESGIRNYFSEVITSDAAGVSKPHAGFFNYALAKAVATTSESLVIGDSQQYDVKGALESGIDAVFFNPRKKEPVYKSTYEVYALKQLEEIL